MPVFQITEDDGNIELPPGSKVPQFPEYLTKQAFMEWIEKCAADAVLVGDAGDLLDWLP
jgi:hypothetical protein